MRYIRHHLGTVERLSEQERQVLLGGSLVVHGSISVDRTNGGNLRICKTHTPAETLTIERADIGDLIAGLRFHGLVG